MLFMGFISNLTSGISSVPRFFSLVTGIPLIIGAAAFYYGASMGKGFPDPVNLIWYIAFGFAGTIFLALALLFLIVPVYSRKKREYAKRFGTEITTDFFNVELNLRLSINGKSPYIIQSIGKGPMGEKMLYKSESIWFNPERFVPKKIKVKVHPNDPNTYVMDISFLDNVVDKVTEQ
jgi:hypothetical protein